MEHPRIARKAASHGMLHSRYAQTRNSTYDPYSGRLLQEPRPAREALGPRPTAPAVESMLKTATETGDIGIFSIKPTRAQRPPPKQPSLQQLKARKYSHGYSDLIQYPPPEQYRSRDDRRRLPSYNRGIAPTEVASLYETGSQKSEVSSRVQEEPEYRSYSMTHTSHSSYTLSNHKSYTSLRSQPDAQLQRPRSPFPYPARLKRHGFRPSSPVLTDGAIDYSRRAEIERIPAVPYVNGNSSSSSPSSLYAQKRLPPLRIDSNKPTPSMLGPSSPIRRQTSPVPLEDTDKHAHQRALKDNLPVPDDNSPTRSTYSFSSTVNLYQTGPPASATNTPGRVPPPSPKYYDYTEDFYPEEQLQSSLNEPPPRFQLERTIHEDRPLSANWSKTGPVEASTAHAASSFEEQVNLSTDETILQSVENGRLSVRPPVPDKDIPFIPEKPVPGRHARSSTIDSLEHIVQMYENNRIPSRPLNLGPSLEERLENDRSAWSSLQNSFDLARNEHVLDDCKESRGPEEEIKTPTSTQSLVNHWIDDSETDADKGAQDTNTDTHLKTIGDMVASHLKPSPHPSYDVSMLPLLNDGRYNSELPQRSTSSQSIRFRSSRLLSDGNGLQGLAQMLANYQPDSGPDVPPKQQSSSIRRAITTTKPIVSKNHINDLPIPLPDPSRPVVQTQSRLIGSVPNYSHQIPSKLPREIPMLAPKPISPARQLKLKNSIPQLMKALPTLPKDQRDENLKAFSPPSRQTSVEITLPFRFSPLFLEPNTNATPTLETDEQSNAPVYQIAAQPTTPPPPPKLKLRRRPSSGYRPKSSNSSQPWNIDENYPWTDQAPNVHLPSLIKDEPIVLPKRPKFKLKVSRPPKSAFGTILINKDSGAPKKQVVFDLKNHKDLFTPQNGLDHMFRGMKRHFSSRKTSASSQNARSVSSAATASIPAISRSRSHENLSTSKDIALTPKLQTPTETRSFFSDDSSHVVNHSLRRRLSHIRAKLPVPYISKTGAHSYDDILWRERSVAENQLMARTRLNLDTVGVNDADGAESLENARTHRLRARVSGWLERARTAMAAVVKTGRSTDRRQRKMYSGV